jgi:hypothetical protein
MSPLSSAADAKNAEPDWDTINNPTKLRRGRSTRRPNMKKAIFAALAAMGISLATTALAPVANAHTYLFQANQNEGANS